MSEHTFRILTFNHLLMYTNPDRKYPIFIKKLLFLSGLIYGSYLAERRGLKLKHSTSIETCDKLIFHSNTPNQLAQVNIIKRKYASGESVCDFQNVGFRDFLKASHKHNALFRICKIRPRNKRLFDLANVFSLFRLCGKALEEVRVPPRFWLRYGYVLSPVLKEFIQSAYLLSSVSSAETVYFTDYSSVSAIIAEAFNNKGISTVSWLHGGCGFTFAHRSVCKKTVLRDRSDIKFLKKYSFSEQYTFFPKHRGFALKTNYNAEYDREFACLGYATNLFCLFGSSPCAEEKYNPLIVNDGYTCNDIVLNFLIQKNIRHLHIKLHPRENKKSYRVFLKSVMEYRIEITLHSDLDSFLDAPFLHVVCHPSSVCLELIETSRRVYIYQTKILQIDRESTLGHLSQSVGFTSLADLNHLSNVYYKNYRDLVKSALSDNI